jgi:hypothetical protein
VGELRAGASAADVEAALLASGEYQAGHASDAAFVAGLYQDVLGRPASAGEAGAWATALARGLSRGAAIDLVMASPEALSRAVAADYADYLYRAPDAMGGAALLNLLQAGGPRLEDAAAVGILASDEFFRRASTS